MANPAISVRIGRVRDAADGEAREQQREAETSSKRFHGRSPQMTTATNTATRTHTVRGGTAFTTAGSPSTVGAIPRRGLSSRSAKMRVGKEGDSTCKSRGSADQ